MKGDMNLTVALPLVELKAEHVTVRSDTLAGGSVPARVTRALRTPLASKLPSDVTFLCSSVEGQHSATSAERRRH